MVSLAGVLTPLLDLLFPPRCAHCGRQGQEGGRLCLDCRAQIIRLAPPWCPQCGLPQASPGPCRACQVQPPRLTGIRSAAWYSGPLRPAIHALKYKNARDLAEPLASLLETPWNSLPNPIDAVIPVPLHAARERERGYNQSLLLARGLTRWAHVPIESDMVVRARPTVPQVTLQAHERQRNVAQAFALAHHVPRARVVDRTFVLIDDVCTTGATLAACAATLQAAGAAAVWAVTVARAGWTRHTSGQLIADDQV